MTLNGTWRAFILCAIETAIDNQLNDLTESQLDTFLPLYNGLLDDFDS